MNAKHFDPSKQVRDEKGWFKNVPPKMVKSASPLQDATSFSATLRFHMARNGDTATTLHNAIKRPGDSITRYTVSTWVRGKMRPRYDRSQVFLHRIEQRYGLPKGYLRAKAFPIPTSARALAVRNAIGQDGRLLNWHLPRDFDKLAKPKQQEILTWVRENTFAGTSAYGQFIIKKRGVRYSVRFTKLMGARKRRLTVPRQTGRVVPIDAIEAPDKLSDELRRLLRFKMSPLTAIGLRRINRWNEAGKDTRIRQYGSIFGSLVAHKRSVMRDLGLNPNNLTFALFVFPKLIDWILKWRFNRRGFFGHHDRDTLYHMMAMTRTETGWIRQNRNLAARLKPISGVITKNDIARAKSDWEQTCDIAYKHCQQRRVDLRRFTRKHRDPFDPILAVLDTDSPLREYRKITEEMLRLMPDAKAHPVAAAEAMRSYMMLRLGMHLGLRPGNLRSLRLCGRGEKPKLERELLEMGCGEFRWDTKRKVWEVFAPAAVFKNSESSFFDKKPFHLALPNLAGLYDAIDVYIRQSRPILIGGYRLGPAEDPKSLFITTATAHQKSRPMQNGMFYEHWRYAIQRYGIYNPYTKTGAIKGLLPHGPYAVRDVLATHILKMTGSYELASYALQNTPASVAKHYGRFLPHDKSAQAAKILNEVWKEPSESYRRKGNKLQSPPISARERPKWLRYKKGPKPH